MSEILELETRLSTAITRIGQAAEILANSASAPGPAASENEPNDYAVSQDQTIADLRTQIEEVEKDRDELKDALEVLGREISQLRASNDALRNSNAKLREANAQGIGDAGAISVGLQASLESLQAERSVETKELAVLVKSLMNDVEEAKNA